MRQCKDKKSIRFKIVDCAAEHGVKPAAGKFDTTPKAVRKWLRRRRPGPLQGLDDIPQLWLQIREKGLPKFQYASREAVSGLQFIGHADERALPPAAVFGEIVAGRLLDCGVVFKDSRGQSDNGPEFIGAWNAKEDSIFTKVINSVSGLTHVTIPPGAHTWQSGVETVHRIIEDEFCEVEGFTGRPDFFGKAGTYNLWFNVARKNGYKGKRTPWEIIHELDPTIAPRIVMLPAIDLDAVVQSALDQSHPGGVRCPSASLAIRSVKGQTGRLVLQAGVGGSRFACGKVRLRARIMV